MEATVFYSTYNGTKKWISAEPKPGDPFMMMVLLATGPLKISWVSSSTLRKLGFSRSIRSKLVYKGEDHQAGTYNVSPTCFLHTATSAKPAKSEIVTDTVRYWLYRLNFII